MKAYWAGATAIGLLAAGMTLHAPAATLYVDAGSSAPAPPFAHWATAATKIQDALNVAVDGDTVLVTNGVYNVGGVGVPAFVGGYVTNRVMLSNAVTVASVNGPMVTKIVGGPRIRCAYVGTNAVISGFTLTGANLQNLLMDAISTSGGGAWCEPTGVVTNCIISSNLGVTGGGGYGGSYFNCVVTANSSGTGGGLFRATASGCILNANICNGDGGGAASCVMSNCTLSSNVITGRTDNGGGGAFQCILSNCLVKENSCSVGANWGNGGGTCQGTNYNCVIAGNRDHGLAGGTYTSLNYGCTVMGNLNAGVFASDLLINSIVCSNLGAGVANSLLLSNCTIAANLGGGVVDTGFLFNCVISNNTGVGAIFSPMMSNCWVGGNTGGGIQSNSDIATVYNSIVVGNGVFGVYGAKTYNSSVMVNNGVGILGAPAYNCVISGNLGMGAVSATLDSCSVIDNPGGGIQNASASNCIVYFNDRQGGSNWYAFTNSSSMGYCCTTPAHAGTGNLTNDPMLFAPNLGSGTGDYRLKIGSPCIDSGHTALTYDANGTRRPIDGDADGVATPDMGALEFDPLAIVGTNWLVTHGLDPNDPLVFSRDPDHDGMNNLLEWLAGTDPTNAASVLRVLPVPQRSPGVVTFPSAIGRVYTLLVSGQLPGNWTQVAGQVDVPGTGGVMQLSDPNPVMPAYYRVQLGLP